MDVDFAMLGFVSVKELKEEQRMAINAFFFMEEMFLYVSVLTGFGRSLCYASLPTEVTSSVLHLERSP